MRGRKIVHHRKNHTFEESDIDLVYLTKGFQLGMHQLEHPLRQSMILYLKEASTVMTYRLV
ncbi:MAG: hypothetical protein ACFFFO_15640, partial [Candidatus Thorarchaeota archaeon]